MSTAEPRRHLLRVVCLVTAALTTSLLAPTPARAADASDAYYKAVSKAWSVMSAADGATDETCGPQPWPPHLAACLSAVRGEERVAPQAVALVRGVHLSADASAGALARDAELRRSLPPLPRAVARLRVALERGDRKAYTTATYARAGAALDFLVAAGNIATSAPSAPSTFANDSSTDAVITALAVVGAGAALTLLIGGLLVTRSDRGREEVLESAATEVMGSADALKRLVDQQLGPPDPMERLAIAVESALARYEKTLRKGLMQHPVVIAAVSAIVTVAITSGITALLTKK